MKFSLVAALFASSALAATIDLSQIPACAFSCFTAGAQAAGCGINDLVCQCTTGKTALTNSVTPCVQKACNAADVAQAAAAAVQICAQALSGSQASAVASATGAGSNVTVPTSPTQTKNAAIANGVEALAAGAGVMAAFLF